MFETVEIKQVKVEIGLLVRAMRKQRKISQVELARSLGVSRTSVQNMEQGRNFTADTFLKVIKHMDLLEQLLAELTKTKEHIISAKSMY